MPFSSDGTYTLASSAFVTQTGIKPSPVNMDFNDIGSALSTTRVASIAQSRTQGVGNCRLSLVSSSVIRLDRYNGDGVTLLVPGAGGSNVYSIPVAGVSLTLSGLTAGTYYYVYLSKSSTSADMALSLSTAVYGTHANNGMVVKQIDNTCLLVGALVPATASTVLDTPQNRNIASFFNPPSRSILAEYFAAQANATPTIIGSSANDVTYVRFNKRPGHIIHQSSVSALSGGATNISMQYSNGSLSGLIETSTFTADVAGNFGPTIVSGPAFAETALGSDADSTITVSPFGWNTSGSATFQGSLRGWVI